MKKTTPLISVVITCYNYGKYIAGCLQSVLAQTFKDFEIILVDDGSTDNTNEEIQPYLSDHRLSYIQQENSGQARAKNVGVKNASGKFIAFLDADDLWDVAKLEKQMALFSSEKIGIVYSRARFIDADGRDLDYQVTGKYLQPRRGNVTEFLLMDNFIPFSSSIVRRDCLLSLGAFDESLKMGIDWDLWLRQSTRYHFDFVDEPLLIYRLGHPGQMSKNVEERQRCSDQILNGFIQKYSNFVTKRALRRARAYTYLNRGGYQADRNANQAFSYYIRSFFQWPFSLRPVLGILKLALTKPTR